MSLATPTLISRSGHFPHLLPPIPNQGEPKPPAPRGRSDGRLNTHRDLNREMSDLSDEEAELEGLKNDIRKRGFAWLVPIGRMFTDQEERNDAEDDVGEDDDDSDGLDDERDEDFDDEEDVDHDDSARDLDASLEDMDDADVSEEVEEEDEEVEEEFEE